MNHTERLDAIAPAADLEAGLLAARGVIGDTIAQARTGKRRACALGNSSTPIVTKPRQDDAFRVQRG